MENIQRGVRTLDIAEPDDSAISIILKKHEISYH